MITDQSNHVDALRAEFKAQKIGGIVNYHVWLEKKLMDAQRDQVRTSMAASSNFDMWRESENELVRVRAGIDYVRDWCREQGYTRVLRVIEAHCE